MDATKTETSPTLDRAHYKRNKKTAWLEFLEALKAWMWANKGGQARWTLELDDATRSMTPTSSSRMESRYIASLHA